MSGLIDREETIRAWCLMTCGCKPDECGMTLEENGAEECEFVDFLWHRPEYDCTIDPVKHGRWEMGGGYLFPNWTCSRCKCIFCGTEEFPKKYKFCPQCGTRMDEVVEDENRKSNRKN